MKIYSSTRSIFADENIYNGMKFDDWQMIQIEEGLKSGVDVSIYADPDFNYKQMRQIRKGLESGVDVSIYADPKFGYYEMGEIRLGLESGFDVSIYADPKFNDYQMSEIRQGLESGVDVSIYADPKFGGSQMYQIRLGLENGVDVSLYADPKLDSIQMQQIKDRLVSAHRDNKFYKSQTAGIKKRTSSTSSPGNNQLFDLCQSEIDDMDSDYDNDTLDTIYDKLVNAVEFRLDREMTDEEQNLIVDWLESNSFVFPEYGYDDDYYED